MEMLELASRHSHRRPSRWVETSKAKADFPCPNRRHSSLIRYPLRFDGSKLVLVEISRKSCKSSEVTSK